jgi:Tfp pilus assembly protein PilX
MKPHPNNWPLRDGATKQRGVVLFIALIALVVMSLAAVALVRSVDTSTIIAGNLAFKQSATSSADSGLESAIGWLTAEATSAANVNKNLWTDGTHTLNVTNAAVGYYSNVDNTLDLAADSTWSSGSSMDAGADATGNAIRYIIQRMCRNPNQVVSTANCLFGSGEGSNGEQLAGELSISSATASAMYRITARVAGPRNTISYIQAFVY